MSFLRQTSSLGRLQRSQLQPITRCLLNPRVNSPVLHHLRRPFNTSISRARGEPSPRVRAKQYRHKYDEDDDWEPPPRFSRFFNAPNIVVGGLIGACIGMYGYAAFISSAIRTQGSSKAIASQRWLHNHFIHSLTNMKEGRYYTLVTSAFMHQSLLHLTMNMIGLWGFGRTIVLAFGTPSFLVLYFGSVVAGGLLQNYMWERRSQYGMGGLGASGGVLGVFAVTACWMPRGTVGFLFVPMPMWMGAALMVGISVGGMQDPPLWLPTFGHADHLGGLAFGALWWLVAMRRGRFYRSR